MWQMLVLLPAEAHLYFHRPSAARKFGKGGNSREIYVHLISPRELLPKALRLLKPRAAIGRRKTRRAALHRTIKHV